MLIHVRMRPGGSIDRQTEATIVYAKRFDPQSVPALALADRLSLNVCLSSSTPFVWHYAVSRLNIAWINMFYMADWED